MKSAQGVLNISLDGAPRLGSPKSGAPLRACPSSPLPPEWEIDSEVIKGMVGGYRRIKDGARLQKHAGLGLWILSMGQWVVDRIEVGDPPLSWADSVLPG